MPNTPKEFSQVIKAISSVDWDLFAISRIYHKLQHNEKLIVEEEQKKWIISWCQSNENTIDFKKAIKITGPNNFNVSWTATYLHYYFERFDVPLKRQTLLDMLCFIYDRNGFGKLEAKLTKSELEEQVLKNLQNGLPFNGVLRNHLKYCMENRAFRAFLYALKEIMRTGSDGEAKRIALSLLLKDEIGLRMLVSEIGNIFDDFKWEVINAIIEINPAEVRRYLHSVFRSSNYDQQIKACLLLVTLQDIEALTFYVKHIKEANSFDKIAANECTLRKLRSKHAIPSLIDLLRLSLQDDFIQTDDFDRLERIVLDSLKAIGSVSEENYFEVKSEVTKLVKKESIHNQKAFWINVFLEQLDHQYYIQKINILNVEDVIARMKIIERRV